MTEPARTADDESSEQNPVSLRLGVYDSSGSDRKAVARLEVSAKLDGSCDVKILSESDASVTQIRELLERNRTGGSGQPRQSTTAEEALEKGRKKLQQLLTDNGYEVEVLPAGDHNLSFVMDMRTGAMVGTHERLHDAVASDSDNIARRIFDSIAEKFKAVPNELAARISSACISGSHAEAIGLVCEAYESGHAGLPATEVLVEALQLIDLALATDDQRLIVQKWQVYAGSAVGRFDVAGEAAEALLCERGQLFSAEQICELRMIVATAAMKRGSKETALIIWRELLNEPRSLGAENRGWAWRNISFALSVDDPETLQTAQYSADAFLEAGNKGEAAKSLMRVANCLLHCEPARAISKIDEILPLFNSDTLTYRPVKAATLHARADRLMKLGRYADALTDAQAAANTWRGIMGTESELVSSLYLGAFAAQSAGDESTNARLKSEADNLSLTLDTPRFEFGHRLESLLKAYNRDDALILLADAARVGDHEVVASVRYVQATNDATLSESRRLMLLEEWLHALENFSSHSSMIVSLQCAIGNQLVKMSQYKRALGWYEKAIREEPLDRNARQGLLECLRKTEAWGEAVLFLKSQLALFGELPGLMLAYGQSMFEAGDMPGAFRALRKAEEHAASTSQIKDQARFLAERAFALAGIIPPLTQASDPTLPVTLDELDEALEYFSSFISGAKRMVFWTKPDSSDYVWVEKPERQAQILLHTFLKARFQERIDVFEELATGAGRLDVYVQLSGGLATIIELKMCGFRYSSSYASAGEKQISHYMDNRRSSIGYLLVFDSRLRDFASPLTDVPHQDCLTIRTRFVDVRPRVTTQGGKK